MKQELKQKIISQLKPNSNIFLVARRGCGKTYLGQAIQGLMKRKVIIDRNGEYTGDQYIFAFGFKDFSEKLVKLQDMESYALVFHFNPNENEYEVFDSICKLVYAAGDLTFVVEEVHHYCKPQFVPKWLKEIAASGRHRNIGYIFTSVSPSLINKLLFSLCDFYFIGHLLNKNDREYFSDVLGDDVKKITYLKPRQFYFYSVLNNESILIQT